MPSLVPLAASAMSSVTVVALFAAIGHNDRAGITQGPDDRRVHRAQARRVVPAGRIAGGEVGECAVGTMQQNVLELAKQAAGNLDGIEIRFDERRRCRRLYCGDGNLQPRARRDSRAAPDGQGASGIGVGQNDIYGAEIAACIQNTQERLRPSLRGREYGALPDGGRRCHGRGTF